MMRLAKRIANPRTDEVMPARMRLFDPNTAVATTRCDIGDPCHGTNDQAELSRRQTRTTGTSLWKLCLLAIFPCHGHAASELGWLGRPMVDSPAAREFAFRGLQGRRDSRVDSQYGSNSGAETPQPRFTRTTGQMASEPGGSDRSDAV
jgi:hypothetical protein